MIYEGTTPTHTFELEEVPFDLTTSKRIRLIYSQNNKVLFVKEKDDLTISETVIEHKLTQEETLAFDTRYFVEIQIRVLTEGNDALASDIITTTVGRLLEDEVMV